MRTSHTPAALHATLQFVIAGDLPSEHRAVLIDVLMQRLGEQEPAPARVQAAEAGAQWQSHEITQLQSFLQGKMAKSWQHADEWVMHLAAQLHRDPKAVRTTAIGLGFGAAVDYRMAKALAPAPEDE